MNIEIHTFPAGSGMSSGKASVVATTRESSRFTTGDSGETTMTTSYEREPATPGSLNLVAGLTRLFRAAEVLARD